MDTANKMLNLSSMRWNRQLSTFLHSDPTEWWKVNYNLIPHNSSKKWLSIWCAQGTIILDETLTLLLLGLEFEILP